MHGVEHFKTGVYMLQTNVLQLIYFFFCSPCLEKVVEMISFSLQTCATCNKHTVHCTSNFYTCIDARLAAVVKIMSLFCNIFPWCTSVHQENKPTEYTIFCSFTVNPTCFHPDGYRHTSIQYTIWTGLEIFRIYCTDL